MPRCATINQYYCCAYLAWDRVSAHTFFSGGRARGGPAAAAARGRHGGAARPRPRRGARGRVEGGRRAQPPVRAHLGYTYNVPRYDGLNTRKRGQTGDPLFARSLKPSHLSLLHSALYPIHTKVTPCST